MCHAPDCNKVGLITEHHNDIRDGVSYLASKPFTPKHVHNNPKIHTGRSVQGGEDKLNEYLLKDEEELKGGILIRDLWTQGTDSIHNMSVVNTDAPSYLSKNPKKCLETSEK